MTDPQTWQQVVAHVAELALLASLTWTAAWFFKGRKP